MNPQKSTLYLGFASRLCPDYPIDHCFVRPRKFTPTLFRTGEEQNDGPSSIRDPDIENAIKASYLSTFRRAPVPPPELTKSGKPLTKKERKL